MKRKIASHYALINSELRRNIVIELDDRLITAIKEVDNLDSCAGVEFYPGIIIPGMVNAHCHLELSYLRGAIAEGSGFAGFAREIGRVRGNFSDEERLHAASVADSRMWEEGIEVVADIANDPLIMPIKRESKIEYHTFFEFFGLMKESTAEIFGLAREHDASVTPHSTYSVQDGPFREICATDDSPISLHFLESDDETELYNHGGSLHAWYERMGWCPDFLHYATPAERVAKSIAATRRIMLIHNCKTTARDVELMHNHFRAGIGWVVCPESNRYISRLTPPVDMLRSKGANIAIGTDSLASARTLSIVDNLRLLDGIPLVELLEWATRGGAKALGIDDKYGTLEVGKSPGIVLIEGADLHQLRLNANSHSRRII